MERINLSDTPLSEIDCSFESYVAGRKQQLSRHISGNGLPDYAYSMDYEYRKKLDAVPGLHKTFRRVLAPQIQQIWQQYNMAGVRATPTQFSELYQMGCDCARVLGIGIPNILVVSHIDKFDFNACTYAADDQEPIILVTGLMVQRMTPGELKAVIAHECGHIHNHHSVYQTITNFLISLGANGLLTLPGFAQLYSLLTAGVQALLKTWSRAAEVSCDRAAMICSDSIEDAYSVNKKLAYGGANITSTIEANFDYESLKKQVDMMNQSLYRMNELFMDHPVSIKRLFAEMEFAKCETLYSWRPDLKTPGTVLKSKKETDEICKSILGVIKQRGKKNDG